MAITEKELAEILKRNPDVRIVETIEPKRTSLPMGNNLSAAFVNAWQFLKGPPLVTEYRFHPTRKWRFDFAHLESKTAIEINGGVWSGGRHVRGAGYLRDREKINMATELGWRVFELGTGQVTVDNVQRIIEVIDAA
jgi:very-short-patch-repair endonuclease